MQILLKQNWANVSALLLNSTLFRNGFIVRFRFQMVYIMTDIFYFTLEFG